MIPIPTESTIVDTTRKAGKIASMIRNLIKSAMRESIEEHVTPQLQRLSARIDAVDVRTAESILGLNQRIDILGAQLNQRIDTLGTDLNRRIDTLGERLDHRLDELSQQQGRIVEEVASLKRDKESAADLTRRVTRIEDRLFAGSS
jgi:DNA anti-recombination protein RmuC